MKLKDEIKVKWLGSPVILKRDIDDIYIGDANNLSFTYDKHNKEWFGEYHYILTNKHDRAYITITSRAKSPQLLANKLRKNLDKLFEVFGLEL